MVVMEMPALQMTATRQFIAGLLFITFFISTKQIKLPTAKQFLWLTMMALLCFVFANGISTMAIRYINSGLASLIGALYPLSVFLLQSLFFRKRKFNILTVIGSLLGVAGMSFVFYEQAEITMGTDFYKGIGLSLFAMLSWSLGTIFLARNKFGINPYYAMGWQMMIGSFILLLLSFSMEKPVPLSSIELGTWLKIGYLISFGSILTFIAFIYSNKVLSPSVASLYAYANPFVAMLFAHLVIDEPLTVQLLWGAAITLFGVFLVNRGLKR